MNETLQTIKNRRSTQKFEDTPVPEDIIDAVVEAGRFAPSVMNSQERHFSVVTSKALLEELNRDAKSVAVTLDDRYLSLLAQSENFNMFYNAPVVIFVSAPEKLFAESDCAAAIQNMLLASESLGYGACWINFVLYAFQGAKHDELAKKLQLPEAYLPYGSIILGISAEKPAPREHIKGNFVSKDTNI